MIVIVVRERSLRQLIGPPTHNSEQGFQRSWPKIDSNEDDEVVVVPWLSSSASLYVHTIKLARLFVWVDSNMVSLLNVCRFLSLLGTEPALVVVRVVVVAVDVVGVGVVGSSYHYYDMCHNHVCRVSYERDYYNQYRE